MKKTPYQLAEKREQVYDRRAEDLPMNAQVAVDIVDDPLEPGAKLTVVRSIKDDPLAGMKSRGQIDEAQFEAGRTWQRHHENAAIGGVSAIDPTKEAVDGGTIYQAFSDGQKKALEQLSAAGKALGPYDNALVWQILGMRKSLPDLAENWRMVTQREKDFLGLRFRIALETLAVLWNLAPPKRGPLTTSTKSLSAVTIRHNANGCSNRGL